MNPKSIIDYLTYLWPYRKTKWGLIVISIPIILSWTYFAIPKYFISFDIFFIYSISLLFLWFVILIIWFYLSGRFIPSKQPFTVIFCLKCSDAKSAQYIQNSMKVMISELDKLGLLQKLRIKQIGQDIINSNQQALAYREKFDIDLIIWGEIFFGSQDEKQVCDFKKLFFTYKIPPNLIRANISKLFQNDINIALVNRDWNIYEINSLPDTEKISAHLSEIILLILGLIYAQYSDFAEDSCVILESLFNLLEAKTKNDKILIDDVNKQIKISPTMLRKGRTLDLLLNLYKNMGMHFSENRNYAKGISYLEKCIQYEKKDIEVLSNAAIASFYLDNLDKAKLYTNQMNEVEKNHPIYILNRAFFGINEKNYSSALFFYKEILKRGRNIDKTIIIMVIAFLDERKAENRKEIAYDFAIGILNKFHLQKKEGDIELRRFLKAARKKEQYRELISFLENDIFKNKKKGKNKSKHAPV